MTASTLGRYQIVSQLGRGAMGTVYRALDPAIERTVAIKTLNPELPDENLAEVKERFLREAKSAGKLNHPNVVTVYDVGEAGGIAYIAMEFLEGRSLRQVLDSGEPMPLDFVASIAAQIADALDYAQRYGIVHRDIKPANIMISPSGHAKLTDFGVAYMPSSSMTQTGTVLGSPKYLSPEQVLGLPVDGRADIFALGVVLYEMLVKKTPFEKPDITVFSLMQAICMQPVQRVTELSRDIPAAFDSILARALGKRPEERYQKAAEFASDLRNYKQYVLAATDQTVIAPLTEAEKTLLTRPGVAALDATPLPSRPLSDDPEMKKQMERLAADLETFSMNFDEESRKLEEKAREIWAERERAEREASEPQKEEAAATPEKARSGLLGMLQQQAKAKLDQTGSSLEPMLALSGKLRQAHAYLKDFVQEVNAATPAFGGKISLPFVGNLPPVTVGEGAVDFRTTRVSDKEVIEYVSLTYRMSSPEKIRATLNKDEARMLKAQLERAEIKCEEKETTSGLIQKVPRVALVADCKIVARVRIRADYTAQIVDFLCQNVGGIGASRFRIAADRFGEEAIEEFGKRLIGLPNRFAEMKLLD
jgi:serine/threonine-protein kinase